MISASFFAIAISLERNRQIIRMLERVCSLPSRNENNASELGSGLETVPSVGPVITGETLELDTACGG